jgi:hypothetical protein
MLFFMIFMFPLSGLCVDVVSGSYITVTDA